MNIVIVGKGAIGMLWYSALARLSNHSISLWTRHSDKLSELTFTNFNSLSQNIIINKATTTHLNNADLVIYCVKAYQVHSAITDTLNYLGKEAIIALCHNGMGTLNEIETLLTKEQTILAMLTTHGCLKVSDNHAKHTGLGHTDIGLVKGFLSLVNKQKIVDALSQALPTLTWQENISDKQWRKLSINCVINPLTALAQVKNGEITQEKYITQVSKLCEEITAVAKCQNITLDKQELVENAFTVAKNTARNQSSMLCDVIARKRTEIDYISGFIVRLGLQHHIATPENMALYCEIKKIEPNF